MRFAILLIFPPIILAAFMGISIGHQFLQVFPQ